MSNLLHVITQYLFNYFRFDNVHLYKNKYFLFFSTDSSFDDDPCCRTSGFGRRDEDTLGIYERALSGETPLSGTNLTAGDVGESFTQMATSFDNLPVEIIFMPSQQNAINECMESGLCT